MDVVLFAQCLIVPVAVGFALRLLHPLARSYRFVDMPDRRKRHRRPTPLVGGLGVLLGLILGLVFAGLMAQPLWWTLLAATVLLAFMGAVDDVRPVSAPVRFLAQGLVVGAALWGSGVLIKDLGLLLGARPIHLVWPAGLAFTVLCSLASINAYNMIDGVDGLAASMAGLSLLGVLALSLEGGDIGLALLAGFLVLALLAFMAFNLELPGFGGRKVFLGDGGSTALGFLVVCFLVIGSQDSGSLRPITAVWLVGLPILDMLAVFLRRAFAGQSPFHADRSHIHHLLLAGGLGPRRALLCLAVAQAVLVATGLAGEWFAWSEFVMTSTIIAVGIVYLVASAVLASSVEAHGRMAVGSGFRRLLKKPL